MFAAVIAATGLDPATIEEMEELVEKLLSVDSTSVRAHQHAAGARSDTTVNPQLIPLLDDHTATCRAVGLPSGDFRLLADKAYSHPSTRTHYARR